MIENEFDDEIKYKLFRSVEEILHPTISKKNISNYKIIIDEDILPVRVFYPKKVTGIDKAVIYVHGNGKIATSAQKYSDICKNISKEIDRLVIAIEYNDIKHGYIDMYESIYNTIKYLYKELTKNNIDTENICLMGDSTGANILLGINCLNKKEIDIKKEVLFYPVVTLDNSKYKSVKDNENFNIYLLDNIEEYYKNIAYKKDFDKEILNPIKQDIKDIPNTLIMVGKVDSLKDSIKEYSEKNKNNKYVEIAFAAHGFLNDMDSELETEIYTEIKKFL